MPGQMNRPLVEEILGGDPVLLPAEAAARLGVGELELAVLTDQGGITSIQPGGPAGEHRYRQSAVDTAKARQQAAAS